MSKNAADATCRGDLSSNSQQVQHENAAGLVLLFIGVRIKLLCLRLLGHQHRQDNW
jgi:hypothetical protein